MNKFILIDCHLQIGNWSRWLSDLFGMDVDDTVDDSLVNNDDGEKWGGASGSKCFGLLNSLSDLLMLPKDMLLDRSIKKEVVLIHCIIYVSNANYAILRKIL